MLRISFMKIGTERPHVEFKGSSQLTSIDGGARSVPPCGCGKILLELCCCFGLRCREIAIRGRLRRIRRVGKVAGCQWSMKSTMMAPVTYSIIPYSYNGMLDFGTLHFGHPQERRKWYEVFVCQKVSAQNMSHLDSTFWRIAWLMP